LLHSFMLFGPNSSLSDSRKVTALPRFMRVWVMRHASNILTLCTEYEIIIKLICIILNTGPQTYV
jgi:hypothetical protein